MFLQGFQVHVDYELFFNAILLVLWMQRMNDVHRNVRHSVPYASACKINEQHIFRKATFVQKDIHALVITMLNRCEFVIGPSFQAACNVFGNRSYVYDTMVFFP